MSDKNEFTKLLYLNSKEKVKQFLISNGKLPKPVCPIVFIKDEEEKIIEGNEKEKSNG